MLSPHGLTLWPGERADARDGVTGERASGPWPGPGAAAQDGAADEQRRGGIVVTSGGPRGEARSKIHRTEPGHENSGVSRHRPQLASAMTTEVRSDDLSLTRPRSRLLPRPLKLGRRPMVKGRKATRRATACSGLVRLCQHDWVARADGQASVVKWAAAPGSVSGHGHWPRRRPGWRLPARPRRTQNSPRVWVRADVRHKSLPAAWTAT